jgi:hypothetical protein
VDCAAGAPRLIWKFIFRSEHSLSKMMGRGPVSRFGTTDAIAPRQSDRTSAAVKVEMNFKISHGVTIPAIALGERAWATPHWPEPGRRCRY